MLGHVTHCTIYVSDQQAAHEFYTGKLGFDVVADMSTEMGEHKMRWLTVRAPGGLGPEIALWPGSDRPGESVGGSTGIVLHCPDLDVTHATLSGRGVTFTMAPEDVPWGRHAMLADADGNQIYIVQPAQQGG